METDLPPSRHLLALVGYPSKKTPGYYPITDPAESTLPPDDRFSRALRYSNWKAAIRAGTPPRCARRVPFQTATARALTSKTA